MGGVLEPLQKMTDAIRHALSGAVDGETTHLLTNLLHSAGAISENVHDAKRPVDIMNSDMIDACKRIRNSFTDAGFIKNRKEIMILWICQMAP